MQRSAWIANVASKQRDFVFISDVLCRPAAFLNQTRAWDRRVRFVRYKSRFGHLHQREGQETAAWHSGSCSSVDYLKDGLAA